MLARGAVHNPNIFNELKKHILNKKTNLKSDETSDIINLNEELLNDYTELNKHDNFDDNIDQKIDYKIDDKIDDKIDGKYLNKKKKETKDDEESTDDIKQSKNLAKIFEIKYNNAIIDIVPIIKEFVKIAKELDYSIQNTKYNCLYILKTHKNHLNLFQKIQKIKTYEDIEKAIEGYEFEVENIKDKEIKYNKELQLKN